MRRPLTRAIKSVLILAATLVGCSGDTTTAADPNQPTVAFITNGVDPFWDLAIAGARDAAEEFGVRLIEYAPTGGLTDQENKLEDLLSIGVDGIAVSPIDGANMVPLLNKIASKAHLITHDSDSPGSDRRCFIGCDNYLAGRAVGKMVREALPDGGQLVLCIGRLEQDNAQLRCQGVIDELLGRSLDSTRRDSNDEPISGAGYTILTTLTDNFDQAAAQQKAEDALSKYADLDAFVGLFAYNPPICLDAVRSAKRDVKVIGFDEARATVQGILEGTVVGTVTQNPYQYGYDSVRVLKGLIDGDESVLPENGVLSIPFKVYQKDNAQELMDLLVRVLGE